MKAKVLLAVGAMVLTSALVAGISLADTPPCTGLATATCGWGAQNPLLQGYCCIHQYYAYASCGTGVMSVTQSSTLQCGYLQAILNSSCSGANYPNGCGGFAANTGCVSGNCAQ